MVGGEGQQTEEMENDGRERMKWERGMGEHRQERERW